MHLGLSLRRYAVQECTTVVSSSVSLIISKLAELDTTVVLYMHISLTLFKTS